jgi:hypothetical protein
LTRPILLHDAITKSKAAAALHTKPRPPDLLADLSISSMSKSLLTDQPNVHTLMCNASPRALYGLTP